MIGLRGLGMMALLRLRNAFSLAIAALREIFDESAYARFLARSHATSSPAAYSAFLREQGEIQKRRHRCC